MHIKVGVVGATGYTGVELLRILLRHPSVDVSCVTSRSEAGRAVSDLFPALREHTQLIFSSPDMQELEQLDVVFFATPHAVAMHSVPDLIERGVRVIDLSADYRLQDIPTWEQWYGVEHTSPELVKQAVYGLPEVNRSQLSTAQLVACAGCYPTTIQLGLLPLLKEGLIQTQDIIASAASGVSGAGRKASINTLFGEVNDSFKAYAASGHRHCPEIRQGLDYLAGEQVNLTFVPHLLPINRGILASLYVQPTSAMQQAQIQKVYDDYYRDEFFVDVLEAGQHPTTRSIRGSNMCRIAVHVAEGSGKLVIFSTLDNLVKGASGQAVQCMNIMFGYAEDEGLRNPALVP